MLTYNPNIFLTYKCQVLEIIAEPGRVLENAKHDKEGDLKGHSHSEQDAQERNQLPPRPLQSSHYFQALNHLLRYLLTIQSRDNIIIISFYLRTIPKSLENWNKKKKINIVIPPQSQGVKKKRLNNKARWNHHLQNVWNQRN